MPTSKGGVGPAPRRGGHGPWAVFGILGAVLFGLIAVEAWARMEDSRQRQEALIRLLEEREESLREEIRLALSESETAVALTGSIGDRLAEGERIARAFRDDATRRLAALDEGTEGLRELAAKVDRRSERSAIHIASVEDDLRTLMDQVRLNRPVALRFKEIQRQNQDSIYFVYSEISLRNRDGVIESTIGTYGTGFAVTDEGHIATSKHVAQPWKFREFARQIALRGLEVDPDSYMVAAWQAGSAVLEDDRETLDLSIGFNNLHLGNLRVWSTAEDHYRREVLESLSGDEVEIRYHEANDNQDLVLLKAEGGPFHPVRTSLTDLPEKLDPVMVLGFPRGLDILEKGVAESSPALGTVRKVEDTIYVTASIIPGNSGGPLFDRNGNVIGIATRVVQGTETLGICLKMDHLLALIGKGEDLSDAVRPPIAASERITR